MNGGLVQCPSNAYCQYEKVIQLSSLNAVAVFQEKSEGAKELNLLSILEEIRVLDKYF